MKLNTILMASLKWNWQGSDYSETSSESDGFKMMSEELEIPNEKNEEHSSSSKNKSKSDVSKQKIGSFDESKLIQLFSNMKEKVRSLLGNRIRRPAKIDTIPFY